VKGVVVDAASDRMLWQDYQRHDTRQPEKVLEFLQRMETEAGISQENTRIFITGSGGGTIAEMIGAKFVQEVHAVSLAVDRAQEKDTVHERQVRGRHGRGDRQDQREVENSDCGAGQPEISRHQAAQGCR
jgi:hypothetical protein